jgi:cytoskeletal protein RodZ
VVLRPVGPLPPGAYWLRRLLVLVLLLVVIGAVWLFLTRGSSSPEPAAATPTPSVSEPTSAPTTSDKPKPSKTSPKPQTSSTASPCGNDDIKVTVSANSKTYSDTEFPTFVLAVENTSKNVCTRDVGSPALELRVSSGGSRVWSSDDCNPGGESRLQELAPRESYSQSVQWDKVTSQVGCPTPQDSALPGTYQVVARNVDVLSEPVPFVLQ